MNEEMNVRMGVVGKDDIAMMATRPQLSGA